MTNEDSKTIVRRFYESYNTKDLDTSFDQFISPNLVNHAMGGQLTRESWREGDKTFFPAFPDFAMHVDDQIGEGDKVATHWSITGTQQGSFFGVAPTGKKFKMTAITIDRVADGKIVEHWIKSDFGAVMQSLSAK